MNADHDPGTDIQPRASDGRLQADPPVPWAEFGQQVLAAHHRNGLGAQCVCGSLMYYCPVIAAAQHHGLPTDDPAAAPTPTDSPVSGSDLQLHGDSDAERR